ncbi:MAG: amino acid ABC transporter permease, partial [Bulleidia sp.]|nr:amino acid ABC transporter permease [Bulleidia sp.]
MSIIDVWLEYYPIFLKGALGTLEFAAIAVFFGTLIGTLIAIMHLSKFKVLQWIAKIYTTVLRGTPLLVQMYMAYFFIPMAFPVLNLPKEVCVVLSMVLNSSAYVSEIIRGGILSVDKGQSEAGRSLGLGYKDTMRFIIIPQAVKTILPAMGNEFIQLIKETSILGYVGIMDLTKAASYVSSRT